MGDFKDIKIYDRIIGKHKRCRENDNEIKYLEENEEFHFGCADGIGGWVVIGKCDLIEFLKDLKLIKD